MQWLQRKKSNIVSVALDGPKNAQVSIDSIPKYEMLQLICRGRI